MKLLVVFTILVVFQIGFCSISNINPGPTGAFAALSTTQGLVLSIFLLTVLIMGDFGIIPIKGADLIKGKRSVDSRLPMSSGSLDKETILRAAREADAYDCGLKYLCEVAGMEPEKMTFDEKLLVEITKLGGNPFSMMRKDPSNPLFPYTMAGYVGFTTKGKKCAETFKNCPHNLPEMRTALSQNK